MAHMTQVDAAQLGARIREARERASLTQEALSREVSLDRTALAKVESGSRKITALELSAIAGALGVQMATFFEEPLPALVAHRSSQGLDTADSAIDGRLASLASEVEFIQALGGDELSIRVDPGEPWDRPNSTTEAEDLATEARKLLALDEAEPARGLAQRVGSIGLWAFAVDLGVDTADAGTLMLRRGGLTLVNSHNKVGRRRLALAHELAHYLLQDEYTVDWRVADGSADLEARLDRFARAFLLPANALKNIWRELEDQQLRDRAVIVASRYQVDMATLARRVGELDLNQHPDEIRSVRTTRTDILDHNLLPEPEELGGTWLPEEYQRAVVRLYRDERISAERALELLQGTFDVTDLPARHVRPESAIWNFVS